MTAVLRPGRTPADVPPGHTGPLRGGPSLPVRLVAWLEPRMLVVSSRVAALLGVLALVDALGPQRLHSLAATTLTLPATARAAATAAVAVAGLLLLRIAAGLRRGKRAEWRLAVVASAAVIVADLAREERRPIEAGVAVLLLAGLVAGRRRFRATTDPQGRWYAMRLGVQIYGAGLVLGTVMLFLPGHVPSSASFGDLMASVLRGLVGLGASVPIHDERYADVFAFVMLTIGLLGAVAVVLVALRPAEPEACLSEEDENRLRALLHAQGRRDSLGYFALRRDKDVVWSASGKAAITYRVVSGVALVSGDPIGDPEAWPGAIAAFGDVVRRHGWTPAVMGASELGATVFARECGLRTLALGDEAILHADRFSLDGRVVRSIRHACTRIARAGYVAQVRHVGSLDAAEVAELQGAAVAWRGDAVERGYSMALSRLGDPADPDCVVVTVRRDGTLHGLLHFVPWGPDGLSLDLMRRDRGSENGLNEFMIAAVMGACRDFGVHRVSMNFAVFREALERGDRLGAGPLSRLARTMLVFASRWWQIETLYRFNSRFQPDWQPRFISYPAARHLPRIALASLEAEAFVVRPRLLRRPSAAAGPARHTSSSSR